MANSAFRCWYQYVCRKSMKNSQSYPGLSHLFLHKESNRGNGCLQTLTHKNIINVFILWFVSCCFTYEFKFLNTDSFSKCYILMEAFIITNKHKSCRLTAKLASVGDFPSHRHLSLWLALQKTSCNHAHVMSTYL